MGAYRSYLDLMQRNKSDDMLENIYFNMRILQELYRERPTMEELRTVDMGQFLRAANAVHFIMQEVVTAKFQELSDVPPEEIQKSAFDDYDRENGYEEEGNENIWEAIKENVDRVIKIATRVLNTGYNECMETDIMKLLDYVKFEINTADTAETE